MHRSGNLTDEHDDGVDAAPSLRALAHLAAAAASLVPSLHARLPTRVAAHLAPEAVSAMSGVFRDELEAARMRAEALQETNDELRSELERLRGQAPAGATATAAKERGADPELSRLSESTLDMLDRLVGPESKPGELLSVQQIGALQRIGDDPPSPLGPARQVEPEPMSAQEHAPPYETAGADADGMLEAVQRADERRLRDEHRELRKLRRLRARVPVWGVLVFVAGVIVGLLLRG
ncbi:Hypothetical protein A7982_03495 [Minicystis rosea]|nr:Hypothetical protein A7982_03495 [Minicystis rosea]